MAIAAMSGATCGGEESKPDPQTEVGPTRPAAVPPDAAADATVVGAKRCRACHEAEFEAWQGSDHDRAMQTPAPDTVLGSFDGRELRFGNERYRFVHEGDAYRVELATGDGPVESFEVRYTFGADPLQQYLVETERGQLQSLLVAWDSRPEDAGGQRWYHLQGDEVAPPGDPLHWKEAGYRWNTSCASCHSTGVDIGYDAKTQQFDTTFTEIDVGCEACHGPGSAHADAAQRGETVAVRYPLGKPESRGWSRAAGEPIAKLQGAEPTNEEIERCGPCHARRSFLGNTTGDLSQDHRLALIEPDLYFADGQIRDEVFVVGSFLQSKMHAAGVTCSDCHEPHGLQLRAPGNAMCTTCHGAEVYDQPSHHFHPVGSESAQCTSCHMPTRNYMGVDARGDHRFSVPRPRLSERVGSPDPCLSCHADFSAQRAADAIAKHGGKGSKSTFADPLWRAWAGRSDAYPDLVEVVSDAEEPQIVRASALQAAGQIPGEGWPQLLLAASKNRDPLVRRVAASWLTSLAPAQRVTALAPLLRDPVRSVRLAAFASVLVTGPVPGVSAEEIRGLAEEYRRAQAASADRATGLSNLANLALFEGDATEAKALLKRAIEREPAFAAAYVNLADLHRAAGDDAQAEAVLREALEELPKEPSVRHALGLTLIRLKRLDEALRELEAAYRADPAIIRYGFVYAVALFDTGRRQDAINVLEAVRERHPGSAEVEATLQQYRASL
jgi:tetratricopeptide (TPR) repeat protein